MSKPDTLTYPTASALRDCLRVQAIDSVAGRVVSAVVRYGGPGLATMDGCDCDGEDVDGQPANGTAYVRVAGVAPYDLTPRAGRGGNLRVQRCGLAWAITYELGIMRCYALTESGKPLPATEVDIRAQRFLSDQATLMRAINCCSYLDRHAGTEFVSMAPVGPSGGCAGAIATIRVVQARG